MKPVERRTAIIAATIEVATEKGLAATTARDVAAQMGTSSGLIHHYFDSMDDLLAVAFDKVATADLDRTMAAVAGESDPRARLTAFFHSYTLDGADPAFQLWLDAWAEAARRPALRQTSIAQNRAWQEALAALVADAADSGSLASKDPDATAWRILSLLDGLALQVVAHRANISRVDALDWAMALAESELGLEPGSLANPSIDGE